MRAIALFCTLLSFLGLGIYGLLFVYSTTLAFDSSLLEQLSFSTYFGKQLLFFLTGAAMMVIIYSVPYGRWKTLSPVVFFICAALLVFVLFYGKARGVSRSWMHLGGLTFQPSEIMKIAWVMYLAHLISYKENLRKLTGLFPALGVTAIPVMLILLQPDLGSTLLFIPSLFFMLYLVGARLRHLALLACGGLLLGAAASPFMMSYMQKRIQGYMEQDQHTTSYNFQNHMAKLAIAEGYWTGQGLGKSEINRWDMLPDEHTDFIFAIIAAEWGFVGALGLLALYALLIFAFFLTANSTREQYGKIVVLGLSSMLATQVLVNLAVVLHLIPTTGITLPFISKGGSSILSNCIMIGIVLNVAKHHHIQFAGPDNHMLR